jgi:hypothetical protein
MKIEKIQKMKKIVPWSIRESRHPITHFAHCMPPSPLFLRATAQMLMSFVTAFRLHALNFAIQMHIF